MTDGDHHRNYNQTQWRSTNGGELSDNQSPMSQFLHLWLGEYGNRSGIVGNYMQVGSQGLRKSTVRHAQPSVLEMATNKTGATAMPMSMLTRKETFCRVPLLDKELQQLVSAGEGSPYWLLRAEWSALKPYTRNKNRLSKSCLYVSVTCIQTNMHALTIMTFK